MTALPARLPLPVLSRQAAALLLAGSLLAMAALLLAREDRPGPLGWSGDAEVFAHPTLPGDRILTGVLRNDGPAPLRVDLSDVRVVDADGAVVEATPVFLRAFGTSSLWGRGPEPAQDSELQRTGRIALLAPGEEVPLTVAWRADDGDPVRVDYGRGFLHLPE